MTRSSPIPDPVTLHVPFRVVKRGGRKEMRLPDRASSTSKTDNTLVRALARAFSWKRIIRRIHDHRRAGRTRGHCAVLHDACHALEAALARHRRCHLGW